MRLVPRLSRWAPGLCGLVAAGAAVVGWQEPVPEITAAEAVKVADEAFGAAGVEADVEPDPAAGTYAPSRGGSVEVWTVRASVRSNPVVVLLSRAGAQPMRIDDRTPAGDEYVLSEDEYKTVAVAVEDPARDRAVRRNIALTAAAVLVVAVVVAQGVASGRRSREVE